MAGESASGSSQSLEPTNGSKVRCYLSGADWDGHPEGERFCTPAVLLAGPSTSTVSEPCQRDEILHGIDTNTGQLGFLNGVNVSQHSVNPHGEVHWQQDPDL